MSLSAMARYSETLNPDPRVSEVAEIVNEVLGPDQVCLTLVHLSLDEDSRLQAIVDTYTEDREIFIDTIGPVPDGYYDLIPYHVIDNTVFGTHFKGFRIPGTFEKKYNHNNSLEILIFVARNCPHLLNCLAKI